MKKERCVKCGLEIEEEICNSVNRGRKRYYCNDCLIKIFKLKKPVKVEISPVCC